MSYLLVNYEYKCDGIIYDERGIIYDESTDLRVVISSPSHRLQITRENRKKGDLLPVREIRNSLFRPKFSPPTKMAAIKNFHRKRILRYIKNTLGSVHPQRFNQIFGASQLADMGVSAKWLRRQKFVEKFSDCTKK